MRRALLVWVALCAVVAGLEDLPLPKGHPSAALELFHGDSPHRHHTTEHRRFLTENEVMPGATAVRCPQVAVDATTLGCPQVGSNSINIGCLNKGSGNTGSCNAGNNNTGFFNIGDRNIGDCNIGNGKTGTGNTGDLDHQSGPCPQDTWILGYILCYYYDSLPQCTNPSATYGAEMLYYIKMAADRGSRGLAP